MIPVRIPVSKVTGSSRSRQPRIRRLDLESANRSLKITETLQLMGVELSAPVFLHIALLSVVAGLAARSSGAPYWPLWGMLCPLAVAVCARVLSPRLSKRRLDVLLPELCDGAARLLASGLPLRTALVAAVDALKGPVPVPLQRLSVLLTVGEGLRTACHALANASPDAHFAVECFLSGETIGGDVSGSMQLTADVLRSRRLARAAASNRLAQTRASIAVLVALPIVGTITVLVTLDGGYRNPLAQASGAIGLTALILGAIWSHRIVRKLQ